MWAPGGVDRDMRGMDGSVGVTGAMERKQFKTETDQQRDKLPIPQSARGVHGHTLTLWVASPQQLAGCPQPAQRAPLHEHLPPPTLTDVPTTRSHDADAIVVGAGLAGLVAARTLTEAGRQVLLLESSDDVGGRVRTDRVGGYLLDRGFQLYNPAYPEGRRQLDHEALRLRPFTRGVVLRHGGRDVKLADPREIPRWTVNALRAPLGSLRQRAALARYLHRCATTRTTELTHQIDTSAHVALTTAGVAPEAVDEFLRPFLAGVFLESDLATSRRFLDVVLRTFVRGTPSVPAQGMQQIPVQLAAHLPDGVLQLQRPVREVRTGCVTTDDGDLRADAIIVATDPRTASQLIPQVAVPAMNGVTTWYHSTDDLGISGGRPVLRVDSDNARPVVNTVVMSHAAPSYAPSGRALIASSVLGVGGRADDELSVLQHLADLYSTNTARWETVGVSRIAGALPAMAPPHDFRQPVSLGDGLFVAGDHRDSSSIQGAMVSGRRTAQAVLSYRGALT